MSRDPRIDPQAGDVLAYSGWTRIVQCSFAGRVSYATRCGHQWLNSTQRVALDEWRAWAHEAEVVSTGGES